MRWYLTVYQDADKWWVAEVRQGNGLCVFRVVNGTLMISMMQVADFLQGSST